MTISPIEQTEKTGKIVTLIVSLLFSLWGLIPAFIYKGQLEQAGRSAKPIWNMFWIGIIVNVVLGILFYAVAGAAMIAALNASNNR